MYSNKEFNIFYDQQLLDSIMLTYKNYVIKPEAIYIFRNINDNEFRYIGECVQSCDFRENTGLMINTYQIVKTSILSLAFHKNLFLQELSWQDYSNKRNFIILVCKHSPCKVTLDNISKNFYLQAIFTAKKKHYKIQIIWRISSK